MLHSRPVASIDESNGYEKIAADYIARRGSKSGGIGARVVADWSQQLPAGGSILDVGCGNGIPISEVLIERGFQVYGVDASQAMVEGFRARFPGVPVQCSSVDDSDFFGRSFDAVVAWGVVFLLAEDAQRRLLAKIGGVLRSGGLLLFTAPRQRCSWSDAMTGERSVSLGDEEYQRVLESAGLVVTGTESDEGENHYYLARMD
ncbi:class I SAM-dependent methyltransferase [Paludibaculum fermentans]|uniref:class I SAM-dependent methyltransferase n=1 Tax=Paludibaculum fermentans TaxID=1473598 RepID=UPI003EB8655D